jgi:GNAT superfamily N-acetyltransferase
LMRSQAAYHLQCVGNEWQMNEVAIRTADTQDLYALVPLYLEFHEFHVHGVPDRLVSLGDPRRFDPAALLARLEEIIASAESAILVAHVAGECVGLAEVYVRQGEANPAGVAHRYGLLQSLMVQEAYRGRGIGTRLVEAAERWAREQGATEVRVETWEFVEGPLGFYEKVGYRTLRRTLVREL